jgi:flagellar basal-body rod modification protein FlgD
MGIISAINSETSGSSLNTATRNTLDKDDFLHLLITKLTHQDPMKPMDDEAFVAQLAQFSSLEQLQNMNQSLDSSLEWDYLQMQTINNTMATSLIGKEIDANYSGIYLGTDNQPDIKFTTAEYAESVTAKIVDADGNTVRTLTLDDVSPGQSSITWDGNDEDGTRLAAGFYSVEVNAVNGRGDSFAPSLYVNGEVTGVIYRGGSAYLLVDGLEIPLSDVTAVKI